MKELVVLNSESESIQYLCGVDKRFAAVFSRIGEISYKPYDDGYKFLVNQIVGQMLSNKAAAIIYKRFEDLCDGNVCLEIIDQLTDNQIRGVGLARSKVNFIRELTKAVKERSIVFEDLECLSDAEVLRTLTAIKGIGSWSAKMYLIFVLDRKDVLPYEDVAFLQGYGWTYNTKDFSKSSIENRCAKWKPYSSIAARYMYRALDSGITKQSFGDGFLEGYEYLNKIRDFLQKRGIDVSGLSVLQEINSRKAGKEYTIREHIRSMIYSMLSNQTKWYHIEPHLPEIDKVFFDYNPEIILHTNPEFFSKSLFNIKCGNVSTRAQMSVLADNINTFRRIEKEYGSIDAFITSGPTIDIVEKMSKKSSPYKLKMLGEALVWEYLKKVGIDGAKPDTHLRRFLGADRMGVCDNSLATIHDVNKQIDQIARETGLPKAEIDYLIWNFCAEGYGAVCTAMPHCSICPIKPWCNMN